MRVFIIGDTENVNSIENFERAEDALHNENQRDVINPAKIEAMFPASIQEYEKAEIMLALLSICDSVYLMQNWRKCKIAYMLVGFARGRHMKVVELQTGVEMKREA